MSGLSISIGKRGITDELSWQVYHSQVQGLLTLVVKILSDGEDEQCWRRKTLTHRRGTKEETWKRGRQPVEKNRDGTRAEIMFMDEITNVTVV
ncbi:hypothetical protein DPX16_20055 [Anabarilius grahami]|uniref:Uncharacterized protein n=1 Tax=Anabarilius grahami TaxID=495550 RepID=A0A3N0XQL1_ANAGA|nr:hypothetical protein DPX16_20055 [Anabarilius grahami]